MSGSEESLFKQFPSDSSEPYDNLQEFPKAFLETQFFVYEWV